MELQEFLETSPIFADFSQGELQVLGKALRVDAFPAEHLFAEEGSKDSTMYIIMEGEVHATRKRVRQRGYEYVRILRPGDLFGLQSLIDGQPRYTSCRAKAPTTAASLPHSAFELLYSSHVSIAEHFQFIVTRQLVAELRAIDRQLIRALPAGDLQGLLPPPAE